MPDPRIPTDTELEEWQRLAETLTASDWHPGEIRLIKQAVPQLVAAVRALKGAVRDLLDTPTDAPTLHQYKAARRLVEDDHA